MQVTLLQAQASPRSQSSVRVWDVPGSTHQSLVRATGVKALKHCQDESVAYMYLRGLLAKSPSVVCVSSFQRKTARCGGQSFLTEDGSCRDPRWS